MVALLVNEYRSILLVVFQHVQQVNKRIGLPCHPDAIAVKESSVYRKSGIFCFVPQKLQNCLLHEYLIAVSFLNILKDIQVIEKLYYIFR